MTRTVSAVALCLLLAGCGAPPPTGRTEPSVHPDVARDRALASRYGRDPDVAQADAPGVPGRTEAGPTDRILVTVNGQAVLAARVDEVIGHLRSRYPKATYERIERQVAGELVKDALIDQFLRSKAYVPTARELEDEVGRMRRAFDASRAADGRSFEAELLERGVNPAALKDNPTSGMRFSCYVHTLMTETDVLRTFEVDRAAFDGTQVRASHVLVDTRSISTPQARDELREKAEQVRARAAAGEDFAALARAFSDDPSRDAGGDLGFFPRHSLLPDSLAAAAFALRGGEISPVVESSLGFHVITVTDTKRGKLVALDDVRAEVEEAWALAKGREIYGSLVTSATIQWGPPPN